MICTQTDARLALFATYGHEAHSWKLTTKCRIALVPICQTNTGTPTLAWRKLETGPRSLVHMGRMLPGGAIDWDWTYIGVPSQQVAA